MTPKPQDLLALMPFSVQCGIELVSARGEEVIARMAWAPERCTTAGVLHGGALMALADSCGGICAFLNLPEGANTSTIESKTNFFRAVRDGTLTATSHPLHIGSTVIAVQTNIRDEEDRLVAQVTQTQAVLKGR